MEADRTTVSNDFCRGNTYDKMRQSEVTLEQNTSEKGQKKDFLDSRGISESEFISRLGVEQTLHKYETSARLRCGVRKKRLMNKR